MNFLEYRDRRLRSNGFEKLFTRSRIVFIILGATILFHGLSEASGSWKLNFPPRSQRLPLVALSRIPARYSQGPWNSFYLPIWFPRIPWFPALVLGRNSTIPGVTTVSRAKKEQKERRIFPRVEKSIIGVGDEFATNIPAGQTNSAEYRVFRVFCHRVRT